MDAKIRFNGLTDYEFGSEENPGNWEDFCNFAECHYDDVKILATAGNLEYYDGNDAHQAAIEMLIQLYNESLERK